MRAKSPTRAKATSSLISCLHKRPTAYLNSAILLTHTFTAPSLSSICFSTPKTAKTCFCYLCINSSCPSDSSNAFPVIILTKYFNPIPLNISQFSLNHTRLPTRSKNQNIYLYQIQSDHLSIRHYSVVKPDINMVS